MLLISNNKHSIGFLFFAFSFFVLNLSGDHLFNKVNTFKLVTLAIIIILALMMIIIQRAKYLKEKPLFLNILVILSLPIWATMIGLFISDGEYSYALPYELSSQLLCIFWASLLVLILVEEERPELFLWFLIPTICFVIIISLLEKIGLNPLIKLNLNPVESNRLNEQAPYLGVINRVKSTFGNPNYFAGFIIQLLPLITAFSIIKKHNKYLFLNLITLIILMIFTLFFTETRAAIVALVFAAFIFTTLYLMVITTNKKAYFYVLGICFTTALALYLFSDLNAIDRLKNLTSIDAWIARFVVWETSWNSILDAPFFGHGIGSSYQLAFNFNESDIALHGITNSYRHAHSEFLEVLQEGGVFGLVVFIIVWTWILRLLWLIISNQKLDMPIRLIGIAMMSGLIAFLIHGCFSVAPRMISTRIVAYTYIAVTVAMAIKYKTIKLEYVKFKYLPFASIFLSFSSLALIVYWIMPYSMTQYRSIEYKTTNDQTALIKLALTSENSYLLDEIAVLAEQSNNYEILDKAASKLMSVFPNYRQAEYFQAYAAFLAKDYSRSKTLALAAQQRNTYSLKLAKLLAKIALQSNDKRLFSQQLSNVFTLLFCQNKISQCQTIQGRIEQITQPIEIITSKNTTNVIIDQDLIIYLKKFANLNKTLANDQATIKDIATILGRAEYFQPKPLPKNSINKLARFLALNSHLNNAKFNQYYLNQAAWPQGLMAQINHYWSVKNKWSINQQNQKNERDQIKLELNEHFNLDEFVKKRRLVIELSAWLSDVALSSPNNALY